MAHEMTYVRPESLIEAIAAFEGAQGKVGVLCGGAFDRSRLLDADVLIDIQNIGPDEEPEVGALVFGPGETLVDLQQAMVQYADFERVVVAEAGLNIRNTLSLFNFLKIADGRSPLLVALRAMNVVLRWQPGNQVMCLEEYLGTRQQDNPGFWSGLVIEAPKAFVFESVARTPLDKPIVALGMTRLNNGKLRVAVGGSVNLPVSIDLPTSGGAGKEWIMQAFESLDDAWASSAYRQDVAGVLFGRLVEKIHSGKDGGVM
ncbi:MAG: hypothetical protein WBI14_10310 [Anaerolineaceae bacterium]